MDADPVERSVAYLRRVREGAPTHDVAAWLRDADRPVLADALDDDDARLAFWLNVYNATAQEVLAAAPEAFEDRRSFFGAPLATVAGADLSLDDIEHGLLRRSHPKWGLGYVPNPFPGAFERRFRVDERDPRVHFALNCGAAACPPIAAYERERVDEQLRLATGGYLDATVEYDPAADVARVPRLMLWFHGDFGGRAGVLRLLRDHDVIPEDASPAVRYREYDWSLSLGDFTEL